MRIGLARIKRLIEWNLEMLGEICPNCGSKEGPPRGVCKECGVWAPKLEDLKPRGQRTKG